jgi:hypothetical protein
MASLVSGAAGLTCTCNSQANERFSLPCNRDCVENAMPEDATDFNDAAFVPFTNVAGDAPVCAQTAIDPPPVEGLAGALYAPRSGCDVSGNTVLTSDDLGCPADAPCTLAASGVAGFVGRPCPGGGCGVDFGFDVDIPDFTIVVDCPVLGFGDACEDINVSEVGVNGTSLLPGGAMLDGSGFGVFGDDLIELSTRALEDDTVTVFGTTNPTPTEVVVDFAGKTCAIDQQLPDVVISAEDSTLTLDASIHLEGTIFNQPPTAQAGADQIVECDSAEGAMVTLDGSGSTDPDDDISWYAWRTGPSFGAPVLSSGTDPSVSVPQGAGEQLYSLRVFDSYSSMHHDTVLVRVEDTTAPEIESATLTRTCLWSPNHEYVRFDLGEELAVEVADACDAAPSVAVVSVSSDQPDDAPGGGDGSTSQDVIFGASGFCVRAERGKTQRTYTVVVAAEDGAGNTALAELAIVVPHSSQPGCPALPDSDFIDDEAAGAACSF